MAVSVRRSAFFVVVVAAVYFQIYQAQDIQIRCSCMTAKKFTKLNITDFEVLESRSGCDKTELIVTVTKDNATEKMCLNPDGKMGQAFIKCWEKKNKNETLKIECINKSRRPN